MSRFFTFSDRLFHSIVTALLYSAFVLYLCVLPSETLPKDTNDKLAHLLAFSGISFLWQAVSSQWIKVLAGGTFFAIAIEVIQANLPDSFHRSGDWKDVAADVIGLLLGFAMLAVYQRISTSLK
jgi:VanZ family protein